MKKIIKGIGITLVVIIALLLIVPTFFSGPIEKVVKQTVNDMLDATVDYDDFSLSLFSSFPDFRVSLEGISVVGKNKFEGDTLAYVGKVAADVDLLSVFSGEYVINGVLLADTKLNAIVAADSTANWDIYKAAEDTVVEEEVDTTSSALNLKLDKVAIQNANIAYLDSTSNLYAKIKDLNLDLTGAMHGDVTSLDLLLAIAGIYVDMEDTRYLNGPSVDFNATIEADLANNKYTFKENELNFAGIALAFDGFAQLKDSSTAIDLKLAAKETSFKTLLALIPESIMKDVEGLQMDGTFELFADVNGEYIDLEHIPAIDAAFRINNGLVKYPDLPKSLSNINVALEVKNPSGSADLTTVDLSKFHLELGGNPFDAGLHLQTPISNATFNANVLGKIDLNSLKDALPLDSMNITGIIDADINVATDLAAIEKEDYENIKAEGNLELTNFNFTADMLPMGVDISNAKLVVTPKNLELNPLKVQLGQSDFDVTGKVQSYLPYVLSDGTIKGTVTLASNKIDANELMTLAGETDTTAVETAETTEVAEADTTSAGVVEIPKNIDFNIAANIKQLLYDKLTISNIHGGIVVKDGIADLNGLKLGLCDGEVALNGEYNTANIEEPKIDMAIGLTNININALTNSFSTIDSLLPIAKSAHGNISASLNIKSVLDQQMSPIMKTVNGGGSFSSQDISLKGSDFQQKLGKVLNSTKYDEMNLKNLKGTFTIEDGNIVLAPMPVSISGKQATLNGKQGLDQSMDYSLSIPFTRAEVSSLLGSSINLSSEGSDIPVAIAITGTLKNPKVGIDTEALTETVTGEVKAAVAAKTDSAKAILQETATDALKELKETGNAKDAAAKAKDALGGLFKKKK